MEKNWSKTQSMAMDLARKLLLNDMHHKRMWFKSPWPDEDGRFPIIQSHRIDEQLPTEFPHELLYYREMEDGWAISVGY